MVQKSKLERTPIVLLGDHEENVGVGEKGHRKELAIAANFRTLTGEDRGKEYTTPERLVDMRLEEE